MRNLPFSAEAFLGVIAAYNEAVWPMQLVLNGAALLCVGLLFCGGLWASRLIALLLAGLWLWTALAYHLAFFSKINPAAWWFGILFLCGAVAFDWFGVINDRLHFRPSPNAWTLAGSFLIIFALLVYPALGYAAGRRYPAAITFGLPCPTTIFTVGMLLFARPGVPRAVFIAPVLWSVVGATAALWLDMSEDLWLLAAGAAGAAAMLFPQNQATIGRRAHRRRALHHEQEVGHAAGNGSNRQA